MKKKILICTDNLMHQINGVVTTFTNIASQAMKDGYSVEFITPYAFRHMDCPGYNEVKLCFPFFDIGDMIKTSAPDYIHIPTEGPIGLAAKLYCDRNGIKYNTSYHTKFPEFLKKLYHIPEWITYTYLRWFHRKSTTVLTTTKTMVNELVDNGFVGNIVPWSRGVDRNVFSPGLRTNDIKHESTLIYVGRVSKEKGIDDFCKLQIPITKKIVVGDGPYLAELQRKYSDVEFVGALQGEALATYYANADVMVFPSRTDTFGIVIIEALSVGTPVAAYRVPGPIDILEEGINGYMFDNLESSVICCLRLYRDEVYESSTKWTWESCWEIFKGHLVEVK